MQDSFKGRTGPDLFKSGNARTGSTATSENTQLISFNHTYKYKANLLEPLTIT